MGMHRDRLIARASRSGCTLKCAHQLPIEKIDLYVWSSKTVFRLPSGNVTVVFQVHWTVQPAQQSPFLSRNAIPQCKWPIRRNLHQANTYRASVWNCGHESIRIDKFFILTHAFRIESLWSLFCLLLIMPARIS